jgi:FkbM family methyltransferase
LSRGNIFFQIYRAPNRMRRINEEFIRNKDRIKRLLGMLGHSSSRDFSVLKWQGLTLLLDNKSLVDRDILRTGRWEAKQLKVMLAAIDEVPDKSQCMFLDVGAYWGLYGLMANQHGILDIYMFEPDPSNRSQLYAQLFLNKKSLDFKVYTFATSDTVGEVYFRRSETILNHNRGGAGVLNVEPIDGFTVACRPIDSMISAQGRTIFCKMDVEGAEIPSLRGMENLIRKNKIFIQVEVFSENIAAVRAYAQSLGLQFVRRIDEDDFYKNF